MSTLDRAIAIAAEAHAGQTDKGGQAYILHPIRVMLRPRGETDRIVGVLHDVLEDAPDWTIGRLRSEGFSETELDALEALTRLPGEDYTNFITRAGLNEIARRVKLADLAENMDLSRIPVASRDDRQRVAKYERATETLSR